MMNDKDIERVLMDGIAALSYCSDEQIERSLSAIMAQVGPKKSDFRLLDDEDLAYVAAAGDPSLRAQDQDREK